jgi:hypothetical protein
VPQLRAITILHLTFAAWITLTSIWALIPEVAWEKWDWAFKTLIFSAFIPLTIRSRVQIEAFLQVYMFSLAANLVPFGLKIAISGGGYGQDLSLGGGNMGLSEGSTLAAVSVMSIPIYLYLRQHAVLVPRSFLFRSVYLVLGGLSVLTTIGTFERTGLVGFVTLGIAALIKSRRKLLTLFVGLVISGIVTYAMTGARGYPRLGTIPRRRRRSLGSWCGAGRWISRPRTHSAAGLAPTGLTTSNCLTGHPGSVWPFTASTSRCWVNRAGSACCCFSALP